MLNLEWCSAALSSPCATITPDSQVVLARLRSSEESSLNNP
jgi:hypothetical protein